MKKKVLTITAVALVLFVAVVAAALNAVFTVTKVDTIFYTCSSQGEKEALELQERLDEEFIGASTTFLKLDEIDAMIAEYPCFEVVSLQKEFPRTLSVVVSERKERFAVLRESGMYAVLDEEGRYLYESDENVNRRGGENILLSGFEVVTGTAGEVATGKYFSAAVTLCAVFSKTLDDVRANILSVTLESDYFENYFRIRMQEGVNILIYTPEERTEEKAQAALDRYCSLSVTQKLYGFFDVMEDRSGEISVSDHRA